MEMAGIAPYLITAIFSGGFVGGIVLLLKVRPEVGQITVNAAQGALVVQSGVIEDLNKHVERMDERVTSLENELALTRAELVRVRSERDAAIAEASGSRDKIAALERRVQELEKLQKEGS